MLCPENGDNNAYPWNKMSWIRSFHDSMIQEENMESIESSNLENKDGFLFALLFSHLTILLFKKCIL